MVSSRETVRQDRNYQHEFASRVANFGGKLGKHACHGAGDDPFAVARKPGFREQVAKMENQIEKLQTEVEKLHAELFFQLSFFHIN